MAHWLSETPGADPAFHARRANSLAPCCEKIPSFPAFPQATILYVSRCYEKLCSKFNQLERLEHRSRVTTSPFQTISKVHKAFSELPIRRSRHINAHLTLNPFGCCQVFFCIKSKNVYKIHSLLIGRKFN